MRDYPKQGEPGYEDARAIGYPGEDASPAKRGNPAKHTPGPWAYESCSLPGGGINLIGDGKIILQNIRFNDSPEFVDGAMNAALIMTAPELLQALERISTAIDFYGNSLHEKLDGVHEAREAIAKAKGGAE